MEQILLLVVIVSWIFIPIIVVYLMRKYQKCHGENKMYDDIIVCCKKSINLCDAVNMIFKMISSILKVDEYAFYLLNSKNAQYTLKSIRYKSESDDRVEISYSGLTPHKKKKHMFPLTMNMAETELEMKIVPYGDEKVLNIPIEGKNAIIQLKLAQEKSFNKHIKKKLTTLSQRLEPVMSLLLYIEDLNNRIRILETSKQATRSVASMISGEGVYKMAISMFAKTISAKGGFFLRAEENALELCVDSGFSKESLMMFKYDENLHVFFKNMVGDKKLASISKNDSDFDKIPVYFIADGAKQFILFNINYGENQGIAGFWYDHVYEMDDYQITSLLLMFSKIADIFNNPVQIASNSHDGIKKLKLISTLVDDLSPYTVGFSSLMQYYAGNIARELKLPMNEVQDIELAAFLSNIGIAALSYDIFLAKGKYSEFDYEVIKLHSEVGADIIESIYGDVKVANMVRYHHERMDGCGYPYSLSAADIPIGARILAVAQFFVAKISPRNFREASTFDETMEAMKLVAGTQLDSGIVYTLINWLDKIRLEKIDFEGSMDACWNMRCVSHDICNKCPVKQKHERKCWEVDGNLCITHGNRCETCFVHTEYLGRALLKKGKE